MGKRGPVAKNKLTVAECAPSPADKKMQARWAAEDAMRTLQRAEEIKGDKTLMKNVQEYAREQVKTAQKFAK